MKTINKILSYIANVHKEGTPESAKRFYGGIIVITCLVYIAIWRHDLISDALYTGAGMIIGGTIANKFPNKTGDKK